MGDVLVRVIVVAAVVAAALVLARYSRPWQESAHPPLAIPPGDLPAGVVVFTSTDCDQCAEARSVLRRAGIEYREVTWELEPGRFSRYGVQGVPLVARIDEAGRQHYLGAGVPTRRALRTLRAPQG